MNLIEENSIGEQVAKLPMEKIIDLIRHVRNGLVKELLANDNAQNYFIAQYQKPISKIKLEFLKRDLSEFLIYPVDLVHYSGLIREIREDNSARLSEKNDKLFFKEIDLVFNKYQH